MFNVKPLTPERRAAIYGAEDATMGRTERELVQQAYDAFSDKKKVGMFVDQCNEEQILPALALQKYYGLSDDARILQMMLREMGVNFNYHTLADIYGQDEIKIADLTSKRDFWTKNGVMTLVSALLDHRFFDAMLGDANVFTRFDVPSVRENPWAWTDKKYAEMKANAARIVEQKDVRDANAYIQQVTEATQRLSPEDRAELVEQARDLNMVNTITNDEPFIGYKDRPMENLVGIDSGWMINDVVAEVDPVAPGDKPRGIYLDNTNTTKDYTPVAEGDPGPLAVFKETKESVDLAQYRVGVVASDQTIASMLRLSMINQGVVNLGRKFGRRLKVDAANLIASKLQTGNHPVTNLPYTISTTDTTFSAKVVDELKDSYQVEMVNRAIGKSKPLTNLRRNASVNFVTNNPHYVGEDTTFADIGGVGASIMNCKIDDAALDTTFTDNDAYTFDVTTMVVLSVSPSMEMDAQVNDQAVGVSMRWLRTSLKLWSPEPGKQGLRKVTHA